MSLSLTDYVLSEIDYIERECQNDQAAIDALLPEQERDELSERDRRLLEQATSEAAQQRKSERFEELLDLMFRPDAEIF